MQYDPGGSAKEAASFDGPEGVAFPNCRRDQIASLIGRKISGKQSRPTRGIPNPKGALDRWNENIAILTHCRQQLGA
jgi:hypothetical protein